MSLLKITSGLKNQKVLTEAFVYARICQSLENLFTSNFPEFVDDFKKLIILSKKLDDCLKITLKSSDIQFLSWLKSQNIDDLLSSNLESIGVLDENEILKINYKII